MIIPDWALGVGFIISVVAAAQIVIVKLRAGAACILTLFAGTRLLLAASGALPAMAAAQAAPPEAATLRAEFLRTIARPAAPLAPLPGKLTVENGYRQELLTFASEPGERVPVLMLSKQEARGRRPVIIALHGTGGSKESEREDLQAFAELGFIGVAMDARHHGERAVPIPGLPNP